MLSQCILGNFLNAFSDKRGKQMIKNVVLKHIKGETIQHHSKIKYNILKCQTGVV